MSGQHYRSGFTLLRSVTLSRIFTAIRWLSSFHYLCVVEVDDFSFLRCSFQSIYHSFFIPLTRLRGTECDISFQASSRGSCKAFFTPILLIGNHPGSLAVQSHLTLSYRLFSIQDITPICFASGHQFTFERNSSITSLYDSKRYSLCHVNRTYSCCQDAHYSSGVPFLGSESPALFPESNRRRCFVFTR